MSYATLLNRGCTDTAYAQKEAHFIKKAPCFFIDNGNIGNLFRDSVIIDNWHTTYEHFQSCMENISQCYNEGWEAQVNLTNGNIHQV